MNRTNISIIIHSIVIIALQLFLLRNAGFIFLEKYAFTVLLYPIIILILPLKTPRAFTLVLCFVIGLLIDMFYDSPGVHAATFVMTGYFRSSVLKILEPRGGYRIETSPTISDYGLSWFATYAGLLVFVHILIYFLIDAFTLVYIDRILVNTIASFAISYVLIMLYQVIRR